MKTNEEIQKNVMAEIKWDPELRDVHTQIGIAVEDGVVTLSGLVDTYRKKRAAEVAAQRVRGVRVVACDIAVKIHTYGSKTDAEIAMAVKEALRWNSAIKEDRVEVKVDDGWVSMNGEVDWNFQKAIIEECVENLVGVRGIINDISIKPQKIDLKDIQHKITAAFHRGATVDASAIRLVQESDKIILRGSVRSWAEKKEAERIAWSSPGVKAVENNILVGTRVLA